MEKKQTAVEWLVEQVAGIGLDCGSGIRMKIQVPKDIAEQAKAMEKEQHEETALSIAEILLDKLEGKNDLPSKEAFEQYYKETYGGQESNDTTSYNN